MVTIIPVSTKLTAASYLKLLNKNTMTYANENPGYGLG